jgi:uncharacterized protein YegP (UPF0339 family)
MKLPFDFGIKLVFRLLIPGFFLSLGFLPILNIVLDLTGWGGKFEYAFVILIILLGWLVTIADMNIYMLFEGRRFWPGFLESYFQRREEIRRAKLIELSENSNDAISEEAYFDLGNFPINDHDYHAPYPSRLGNLITAFESYSLRTYGVESIFYWPRIWLKLDKETREEIDNSQAMADSTVYTSFALYVSGLLWSLYAAFNLLQLVALTIRPTLTTSLPSFIVTINQHCPRKVFACALSVVFVIAGFLVYRLSLHLHAQFGELFKSIFDLNVGELNVSEIIEEIAIITEKSPSVCLSRQLDRRDQFSITVRYLRYDRYRCPNPACDALLKPSEIENHVCPRFQALKDATGEWRWNLKDASGRIIVNSPKGYKNKEDCLHDLDLLKASSTAPIKQ